MYHINENFGFYMRKGCRRFQTGRNEGENVMKNYIMLHTINISF